MRRPNKTVRGAAGAFIASAVAAAFISPTLASAHVTLDPATAAAGSWTTFAVKVPNESDTASTVKLQLKMPAGVLSASYEPVAGWSAKVVKSKLAKPIQTDDGPIDEAVTEIDWTATGKGIEPGQYQAFGLTLLVPDATGTDIAFKALQAYSDGHISRWIGAPSSAEPAPTVAVTAAAASDAMGTGHSSMKVSESDSDGHSQTLAIVGIVLGGLALITAAAALAGTRRRQS